MRDRMLIMGTERACLFEPALRGEVALPLDYYDGYMKMLRLAGDEKTDVYASELATPPGHLPDVDPESLWALDADQARLMIRKSYLAALHARHLKARARASAAADALRARRRRRYL